jgi:L-alanine-DL-glutamate epimerase-like enolase superfamily enzyme
MKIESVDFFYLAMPEIRDIGDGSQDALLVRMRGGDHVGWGECEAAPLPTIAAWNCPMSHSACKPVSSSVLGQSLDGVEDIARINQLVRENSFDLLQADHTLSGIDIAMWDLLGGKLEAPVYELLGYEKAYPKTAYASQLFGDDPQDTFRKAEGVCSAGFQATKFGWGPYGRGSVAVDADHVRAAREGLGEDADLLIDAGTVWESDVEQALARLPVLKDCRVLWLEEPFVSGALEAYHSLASESGDVKLAGGEGCHNYYQAINMIKFAGLGYVQIDTGRIGGITPAKAVADYANSAGVTYVNHTFTTPLALSASVQPFAGLETHDLCEFPVEASDLARTLTNESLMPDENGQIQLPQSPGLGLSVREDTIRRYLVEAEISVNGKSIFT